MTTAAVAPLVVRRADMGELGLAADLALEAFAADGPVSHDQRLLAEAVAAGQVPGTYVAAAASGELRGTACLLPNVSEHAHVAGVGELELRLLAVPPVHRGDGVGEVLLRAAAWHAAAESAGELLLSAQPTRLAARRLYERLGFARRPERDWHRDGIDLLVYGLRLQPVCGWCARAVADGDHEACRSSLASVPPRHCAACGSPTTPHARGVTCPHHGTIT